MRHRTPIVAIVLAPVALYGLMALWNHALIPLYRSIWYDDTVLQVRLASDEVAIRLGALKDVTVAAPLDAQFMDKIVTIVGTDEVLEVRKAAARALGHIGTKQALPDGAIRALSEIVLTADDHGLLSNAVVAVGLNRPGFTGGSLV